MIDTLVAYDTDLFLYLNGLGEARFDGFWLWVTNKKSWIPLYVVILVFLLIKLGYKKFLLMLSLALLMVGTADQITNLLKDNVARPRPCYNPMLQEVIRIVKSSCGGKFGFSSAHASNHFAVAVFLSFFLKDHFKWTIVPFILWAAMIAYSRVYIGVHYPLDISFGAILGILIATLYLFIYRTLINRLRL